MVWWKSGVIYQVYPRSFYDTDGNGMGDIRGIIEKLDYLNDGTTNSLGVDAIWISPIYQSPMKDFGYDISDYNSIDPMFGTEDDFDELLEEAHKRNIRVIMDLVVNHTSNQHPWFVESRSSRDNPKRDWYIWEDKKPSNWFSEFSFRSSWNYDELTKSYYYGYFTREQPELNWRNPEVQEAIYNMIRFWFKRGIDGFRIDVINYYIKDDQYRNNPWRIKTSPPEFQNHIYDRNRPETHDIVKAFRKIADEFSERMYIGEVFTDDSALAISYQGNGKDELHMAFNFNFLFQPWLARGFYEKIKEWYDLMPEEGWPNFTLSNHDQIRHFTRYRKLKESVSRGKIAAAMLLTLKGTPTIYYGEEIGMENLILKKADIKDPVGIKYFPFYDGRDGERTPMQWDDTEYSGFSTAKPWLPVHHHYKRNNVAIQSQKEDSLLNLYKTIIWLRKSYKSLSEGDIIIYHKGERDVLGYKRFTEQESTYVYLNFTNSAKQMVRMEVEQEVVFSTERVAGEILSDSMIDLKPYEVLIMI